MKTARENKIPPVCPVCGTGDVPFELREQPVEQMFRGELLKVNSPVMACRSCEFEILAEGQLDELKQRTEDAYRKKHKLLTSAEIVARRTALGMTQKEFADHLDVGIASVKRWEGGYVQEPRNDRRIREKTRESNLLLICQKHGSATKKHKFTWDQVLATSLNSRADIQNLSKWEESLASTALTSWLFERLASYWTSQCLKQEAAFENHIKFYLDSRGRSDADILKTVSRYCEGRRKEKVVAENVTHYRLRSLTGDYSFDEPEEFDAIQSAA